jgi:hypothetical protein
MIQRCKKAILIAAVLAASFSVAAPTPAHAISKNVRGFLIATGAGAAIGLGVGLATLPATNDLRGLAWGTLAGLFLGLSIGTYFLVRKDDPDNPLKALPEEETPQALRKQELQHALEHDVRPATAALALAPPPVVHLQWRVVSF